VRTLRTQKGPGVSQAFFRLVAQRANSRFNMSI